MKKITKRYLSVLLTFALVLALPLAATQEVNAASGGKKINQPVQVTTTSTNPDASTGTTTYVYDKKGLVKQELYSDGSRTDYTYSKTGIEKTWKHYDSKGVLVSEGVNKIKGKKLRTSTTYGIENGQRVLRSTATYKYKKGKLAKRTSVSADGKESSVATFRKNGKMSSNTSTGPNAYSREVYDKHGNITSSVNKDEDGTYTSNYVNTYKKGKLRKQVETSTTADEKGVVWNTTQGTTVFSYTKKGLLKKAVATGTENFTYTDEDENGNPVARTNTSTFTGTDTYTYTKAGLIKSAVNTWVYTSSDGHTSTQTDTLSVAYKKVKVKSKVRKEVKKWLKKFSENKIGWY